jgi:hypothetical protein
MPTKSEYALATLFTVSTALFAADVQAVGTRRFLMNSLSSFEGGDLTGVAIASDGSVRAGLTLSNTPIEDATSVWAAVALGDGSVLLGTGAGGRIYQVKSGKVTIAAETGEMAVSSLVIGPDGDIIAGTFPEGKIFKLPKAGPFDGKKLTPWVTLAGTEDVWSLASDPKSKNVYAATGPEGKLFRINASGKAEVHFDSEETHLVSVAVAPDGVVYAGSNGEALLYKIAAPGRAEVLYDYEVDDVKNIAFDSKGLLYVTANQYYGGYRGLRPMGGGGSFGSSGGGRGILMRFDASGAAETMWDNSGAHFVSLTIDPNDVPFVGAGSDGKVYSVDNNHVTRLEVDTEERQVSAISLVAGNQYIVSSDPVVFHTIKGRGGSDAIWTSRVLDAALRAHFGKIEWDADGTIEVMTRSGNTRTPDNSWSAWSAALTQPGKVASPAARYLQIRARWAKDPNAVLHEVKVSFVTDNVRALVTSVSAGGRGDDTGGSSIPRSGDAPTSSGGRVNINWDIDNPDQDTLRYRLFYKRAGDQEWLGILEPNEELTSNSYSWDTAGLPEGRYFIKVDATDELSNPPDKVTSHSNTSRAVVVDNTPPAISNLSLSGNKLAGTATDEVGPIARLEFAVVGKKTWYPLFPKDNVFDDATETFEVDVSKLVPPGPHMVVVRAYDDAGNRIERTVARGK